MRYCKRLAAPRKASAVNAHTGLFAEHWTINHVLSVTNLRRKWFGVRIASGITEMKILCRKVVHANFTKWLKWIGIFVPVQRWMVMGMINLYPTICNLCGGDVVYTSNATIYGKEYGSGKCYLCQSCGAYTGTHRPRPREALGLLADEPMRKGKVACHDLFDAMWKGKKKAHKKRKDLYSWLADAMGVSIEDCHFGYFDINQLRRAYRILMAVYGKEMRYDNNGKIYFCSYGERKDK